MKILFLGIHGQSNLGYELLLETFLDQLGRGHRYFVNSNDPALTEKVMRPQFNVESFHSARELPRFIGYLFSSDLLFFGGGNIIKEPRLGAGRQSNRALWTLLLTLVFARRILRKRVVMSNIGIGPITSKTADRLAKLILMQADFLSVRDESSFRACLRLGIPASAVRRVPDAVFVNHPKVFLDEAVTLHPAGRLHIALNLNFDIENPAAWDRFLGNLSSALTNLGELLPMEIHALPMQSRLAENDDLTVLKTFRQTHPDLDIVLHDPQTAQEAAEIMAGCDLVLAERLHTLVIAAIIGKPFFALVYNAKVRELVNSLGMAAYSIDINEPFSAQTLATGLRRLLENQVEVREHLLRRSKALRIELATYFHELRTQLS